MSVPVPAFEFARLGEHAEILAGPPFNSEMFTDKPEDVRLVKGENVQQGYVDWQIAKRWPAHDADTYKRFWLVPGDVVVAMDRPWVTAGLKWAYIKRDDPPALLVQRVARLRGRKTLDQDFLRCLISSEYFSSYIQPIVTGVNVPHISGKQIADFRIPMLTLETQQKIAAILSAYDDLIANNQRRIALLERMAEDIYREWFVRLRFPGHEQAKIKKGVPLGWELSTLGGIADFTMGQSPSSEYFNNAGNGLPFHQGVGSYGRRYPNHYTFCSVSGRKAKPGDILFSVRAPVGRLNIADRELIIGRGLAAIRHKHGFNGYLFYLLRVTFATEDIIGNGSIFNSVGKDELARMGVFVPTQKLVEQFNLLVEAIDKQIALLYCANANLKSTRDALLPRLISGKLSLDALDIHFPPNMADEQALGASREKDVPNASTVAAMIEARQMSARANGRNSG